MLSMQEESDLNGHQAESHSIYTAEGDAALKNDSDTTTRKLLPDKKATEGLWL